MYECRCEAEVISQLREEVGKSEQTKPMVMFEDNSACIYTAINPNKAFGQQSKHIGTSIFKLREYVENGTLELKKICSAGNVADCLTKALAREQVEKARNHMLGSEL